MTDKTGENSELRSMLDNLQAVSKAYKYHPALVFMYSLFPIALMAIALRDAENILVTIQIFIIIGVVSSVQYVLLYRVIMKYIGETLLELSKKVIYKEKMDCDD